MDKRTPEDYVATTSTVLRQEFNDRLHPGKTSRKKPYQIASANSVKVEIDNMISEHAVTTYLCNLCLCLSICCDSSF